VRHSHLAVEAVSGREKVLALAAHTYRRLYSGSTKLPVEHSDRVRAVARQTAVVRAFWPEPARSGDGWRLAELVDLLAPEIAR
jgi:hypothetical protein